MFAATVEKNLAKLGLTKLGLEKEENEGPACLTAVIDEKLKPNNPDTGSLRDTNTPDGFATLAP